MKRKASSSSRRPAFPTLLGIVGLLLWVVPPLDAQPISDAEHRANLDEMIRLIDAGEVLFAEDGGDIAPFYPHEVPASELARARIATRVVRDRLQAELDALGPAGGSPNPTSLVPEPRPHRDPDPIDWAVEGTSKEERCDTIRERIPRLEAEEKRLEGELADLEEALRPAREALRDIDAEAEADLAITAVKLSLQTALYAGKVPQKHVQRVESILAPGNAARLDQYVRDASTACSNTALAGIVEIATDYGWACDFIPSPADLRDVHERVPKRLEITKKNDVHRREQELLDLKEESESVSARLRADLMAASSLDCADVIEVPELPPVDWAGTWTVSGQTLASTLERVQTAEFGTLSLSRLGDAEGRERIAVYNRGMGVSLRCAGAVYEGTYSWNPDGEILACEDGRGGIDGRYEHPGARGTFVIRGGRGSFSGWYQPVFGPGTCPAGISCKRSFDWTGRR